VREFFGRTGPALTLSLLTLLWIQPLARADDNILSAAGGTRMIKRTSEDPQAPAANLIEADTGKEWRSGDGALPQEVIFQLPAPARFNTLVFTGARDAPADDWPREVEVYTADPFPTMGGWRLVARATLTPEPGDQAITAPAAEGRFIRLLIRSAQRPGAPRIALGHVKAFLR
jgi:F5/8 type C domain-containing protein